MGADGSAGIVGRSGGPEIGWLERGAGREISGTALLVGAAPERTGANTATPNSTAPWIPADMTYREGRAREAGWDSVRMLNTVGSGKGVLHGASGPLPLAARFRDNPDVAG
jgi:hypothetical protein